MLPQSRRSASATGHFAASAAAEVGYHVHRVRMMSSNSSNRENWTEVGFSQKRLKISSF